MSNSWGLAGEGVNSIYKGYNCTCIVILLKRDTFSLVETCCRILTDLNFTGKYTKEHIVVEVVFMLSMLAMLRHENGDCGVSNHHLIHSTVIVECHIDAVGMSNSLLQQENLRAWLWPLDMIVQNSFKMFKTLYC